MRSESFRTDFFKIEDTLGRYMPFLFKISSIGIYTGFCAVAEFLKSCPKFPLFGPSLIHQLRLLGSEQHPQIGVLLTSFSTWGTENSLAEINLESTGIKVCSVFGGSKIGKHLQLCGRAHYRATRKNLLSRTQLDEPVECASGGDPLLLYKILHLLFIRLVRSLCSLCLESRKNYQHGLEARPSEFQFLRPRVYLTNPLRTLSLCFGVIGKTPGLTSRNNFVCMGHHENVMARCDSIFPLLRCQGVWNKTCTQLSLPQILFQNPKNYSPGDVHRFCYYSWCDATVIFYQISNSSNIYLNSIRFWTATSLVTFGSGPHSHKPSAPILVFLSQRDRLWNKILCQLSVHFRHPWGIKKTDFTRQVITRTLSKINKRNMVCERMLVDST